MEHDKDTCKVKECGVCDEYLGISPKTIRNEIVHSLNLKFDNWLRNVRLTGEEREEIEDIYRDLKSEVDY